MHVIITSALFFLQTLLANQILAIPTSDPSTFSSSPSDDIIITIDDVSIPATPITDDEAPPPTNNTSRLLKRASSVITCAPLIGTTQYEFHLSVCDRPSTRAWKCQSIDANPNQDDMFPDSDLFPPTFHETTGTCGPKQICVDGVTGTLPGHDGPVAYCADVESYFKLSSTLIKKMQQKKPLAVHYSAPKGEGVGDGGKMHAVEAVFAGRTRDDDVTLDSLTVTAQTAQVGGSLANGPWTDVASNRCTGCNSLGIEPVPVGTGRFLVEPVFPAGVVEGSMFWWKM